MDSKDSDNEDSAVDCHTDMDNGHTDELIIKVYEEEESSPSECKTESANIDNDNNEMSHQFPSYRFETTSMKKIEQEQMLSDAVRKFPLLYDKREAGFTRSNDPSQPDWTHVADMLPWVTDGAEACRQFEVLKKRYSKKKMNYLKARHYSYSDQYIEKTKLELDRYAFLNWMEVHIRYRTAKINKEGANSQDLDIEHGNSHNGYYQSQASHPTMADSNHHRPDEFTPGYNEDEQSAVRAAFSRKRTLLPSKFPSATTKKRNPVTIENYRCERNVVTMAQSKIPSPEVTSTAGMADQNDPDDAFLAMVKTQLQCLDRREKCLAKHEISSILFKAQLKQLDGK